MATTKKEEAIVIGIGDEVIELTGADKETFLAERQQLKESHALFETKYKEKQEAKQNILKKLGLTQDELETLLGA